MGRKKKLTEPEIEKAISNVEATLAVEGLKVSKESKEHSRKYLRGEITSEEAIDQIKAKHLSGYCKNRECSQRYWCKRYRTESEPEYNLIPNLKNECNKGNGFKMYKSWKKQD
jgi:hypothetical protein